LWGGGTCTNCGAEVDKWGREVTARRQPFSSGRIKPEDQRALKRGLLSFTAVGFFCLTLLFDWLAIRPSLGQVAWKTWPLWMSLIGAAIAETVVFTALFYSASTYLLGRFVFKEHGRASS
jgi:hypothetical protein